jgi:DNA-binding CsgD family transcriptional regulator
MTKLFDRIQRYRAGQCDAQMAMSEGITVAGIATWRRRLKLPVNHVTPPADRRRIKSMAHTERLRLYRSGLNDREIARRLGTTRSAIVQWRGAHGLPSKYQPKAARALRKPERDAQMLKLYRVGRTDQQMAESLGCAQRTVYRWRQTRALEANDGKPSLHGSIRLVSIDADLSDGGLNLHGLIADNGISEWLETMGSTKW